MWLKLVLSFFPSHPLLSIPLSRALLLPDTKRSLLPLLASIPPSFRIVRRSFPLYSAPSSVLHPYLPPLLSPSPSPLHPPSLPPALPASHSVPPCHRH